MSIIIGGCGSTGTSLLRQVLNRHSQIYIAPETHVFAKNRLFRDWKSNRSNINRRSVFGLRSSGMTMFTGFDLKHSDFDISKKELERLTSSSESFSDFTASIFIPAMQKHGKKTWGEKTPNNIYHFRDIAKQVSNSRCLFMIRNPYDTIASLVSRGYSIGYAVGRCLMTYSFGIAAKSLQNVLVVSYEELVTQPQKALEALCGQLNLYYEAGLMNSGKASNDDSTMMDGWTLDEAAMIQSKAVGRFQKLSEEIKDKIMQASHELRIKDEIAQKLSLKAISLKKVCKNLGYEYLGRGELRGSTSWIDKELSRVKLSRSLRGYPQPFGNFPIVLR